MGRCQAEGIVTVLAMLALVPAMELRKQSSSSGMEAQAGSYLTCHLAPYVLSNGASLTQAVLVQGLFCHTQGFALFLAEGNME